MMNIATSSGRKTTNIDPQRTLYDFYGRKTYLSNDVVKLLTGDSESILSKCLLRSSEINDAVQDVPLKSLGDIETFVQKTDDGIDVYVDASSAEFMTKSSFYSRENGLHLQYNNENAKKIKHDFVCFALSRRHENEYHTSCFSKDLHGTPDVLQLKSNGEIILVEVKTRRVNKNSSLHDARVEALTQYSHITSNMYYLCVSPRKILTNLPITEDEAVEICTAYRLAEAITAHAEAMKYIEYVSDETTRRRQEILNSIISINDDETGELMITNQDVHSVSEHYTSDELRSKFIELFNEAREEMISLPYAKDNTNRCLTNSEMNKMLNKFEAKKAADYLLERTNDENLNPKLYKQQEQSSVIKFPFVYQSSDFHNHVKAIDLKYETVYHELWTCASLSLSGHFHKVEAQAFLAEGVYEDEEKEEMIKKSNLRGDQFKRDIYLSDETKKQLALIGVGGSKFKKSTEKIAATLEQKKFVKLSNDSSCIDRFINEGKELFFKHNDHNILDKNFLSLHNKARNLSIRLNNDSSLEKFETYSMSQMGSFSHLYSLIFHELNLSLTSNVKKDQFIIKKVKNFPVVLFIKPTRGNSHIFISILFDNSDRWLTFRDFDGVFRNPIKLDEDRYCTEFFSMDRHKLSNILPCFEMCALIKESWLDIYKHESEDMWKTCLFTILVYLEDKNGTSKTLQQARYAYMELLSSPQCSQGSLKILKKIPERCRSTLEAWVVKKYLENFPKMSGKATVKTQYDVDEDEVDSEIGEEKISDLINVFTGGKINNFSIALNLSYICQFKNKSGINEIHSSRKIFLKIMDKELEFRKVVVPKIGREDINHKDCENHRYDTKMTSTSGLAMRSTLMRITGVKNKKVFYHLLEDKILQNLDKISVESVATFKSSATVRPYDSVDGISNKDLLKSHRQRALQGVLQLTDILGLDQSSIMCSLSSIFEKFKNKEFGRVVASVFRKQQIGSDREIFILTILSRILILALETISRTLCEMIPWEMLTKGTEKISKLSEHKQKEMREIYIRSKADKYGKNYVLRSYDSDDASSWAQSFVMKMFFDVLKQLLPPKFVPFAKTILNAVTNKKLELSGSLLKEMKSSTENKYIEPALRELFDQFHGFSSFKDLCDKDGTFIKNRSNMMQGILHYTSSLYHACKLNMDMMAFNFHVESVNKFVFRNPSHKMIFPKLIVTAAESSDDSAMAKTIVLNKSDMDKTEMENSVILNNYSLALTAMSIVSRLLGKLFAIQRSKEKSTEDVRSGIIEFNSVWTFRNTILSPKIKYVYPCLMPASIRGIEDKQHQMANLRSQMLENGFCTSTIDFCQMLQAHQFYCTLGMRINSKFDEFSSMISQCPSSGLGFFLYEPTLVCGMFGLDYAQWLACKDKTYVNMEKNLRKIETDISACGKPTVKWSIVIGSDKLYFKFVDSINMKQAEELKEKLSGAMFLRKSKNLDESIYKILSKVKRPSSAESFSFVLPSKVYNVAVHALTHKSVKHMSSVEDKIDKGKHSLLWSIDKMTEISEQKSEITDKLYINSCFPASDVYEQVTNTLVEKSKSNSLSMNRIEQPMAYRFAKISFSKSEFLGLGSLNEAMLRLWYSDGPINEIKASRILSHYQPLIPWLDSDLEKSLQASPFDNEFDMVNHISQITPRSKTISIMVPRLRKVSLSRLIDAVTTYSFIPGHSTVFFRDWSPDLNMITNPARITMSEPILRRFKKINNGLTLLATSPMSDFDKSRLLRDYLYRNIETIQSDPRLSMLLSMLKIDDMRHDDDLIELMSSIKDQAFGFYKKSQILSVTGDRKTWIGEGEYILVVDKLKMSFFLKESFIEKIQCNNLGYLAEKLQIVNRLINHEFTNFNVRESESDSNFFYNCNLRAIVHTAKNRTGYCPIIENTELQLPEIRTCDFTKTLSFKHDCVEMNVIPTRQDSLVGKQTVLRYRLSFSEDMLKAHETAEYDGLPELAENWINNRPLTENEFLFFMITSGIADESEVPNQMKEYYDQLDYSVEEKNKYLGWMQRTLRECLFMNGFVQTSDLERALNAGKKELEIDMHDDVNQTIDDVEGDLKQEADDSAQMFNFSGEKVAAEEEPKPVDTSIFDDFDNFEITEDDPFSFLCLSNKNETDEEKETTNQKESENAEKDPLEKEKRDLLLEELENDIWFEETNPDFDFDKYMETTVVKQEYSSFTICYRSSAFWSEIIDLMTKNPRMISCLSRDEKYDGDYYTFNLLNKLRSDSKIQDKKQVDFNKLANFANMKLKQNKRWKK